MAGCGKPKKEDSELGGGQCALEEQDGGLFRRVAIKSGASTKGGCHGRGACEIKDSNKVVGAQLPVYGVDDKAVVQQLSGDKAKYNNVPCIITDSDGQNKRRVRFTAEEFVNETLWVNIYYLRPQFVVGQLIRGTILELPDGSASGFVQTYGFASSGFVETNLGTNNGGVPDPRGRHFGHGRYGGFGYGGMGGRPHLPPDVRLKKNLANKMFG